jgi:hypothetical protein
MTGSILVAQKVALPNEVEEESKRVIEPGIRCA